MELKELLSTLGMEHVKDIDSFKEQFKGKFITRDEAYSDEDIKGKITGKVAGAATTLLKRLYSLENAEIQGKKWEEIAELGVNKLKAQIEELEGKQGQSNDEALKDLQAKLDKANNSIKEYKEQNSLLQSGLADTEKNWSEKYIGLKKGNLIEKAKSNLSSKLREMTALEKVGFEAAISNNIIIEFDEKDEVIVKGKDGKRIPNPNKIGSFLSLDEALELEATNANVIKKNDGGQQKPTFFQGQQQQNNNNNGQQNNGGQQNNPTRRIHPNALTNAEVLKAQASR